MSEPTPLSNYLADHHVKCACGYDLYGSSGPGCPECGKAVVLIASNHYLHYRAWWLLMLLTLVLVVGELPWSIWNSNIYIRQTWYNAPLDRYSIYLLLSSAMGFFFAAAALVSCIWLLVVGRRRIEYALRTAIAFGCIYLGVRVAMSLLWFSMYL